MGFLNAASSLVVAAALLVASADAFQMPTAATMARTSTVMEAAKVSPPARSRRAREAAKRRIHPAAFQFAQTAAWRLWGGPRPPKRSPRAAAPAQHRTTRPAG